MRKLFNTLFVIIAAMVTFAGCAKEEVNAPAEAKTVQFIAESIETKTVFGTPDGTTYPTLWTANDEKVYVALNSQDEKECTLEKSEDFKTARFEASITDDESGAYKFFALSPSTAKNSMSASVISANIWTSQTPLANSVDEAAQVLYAVSDEYSEFPSSVSLTFRHFTAYGKLSFTNLNLDGAEVTSVAITSSTDFAGRWNYNVASGTFTENSGASTITLNTTATENLWFACAPIDMNGQTLTFTVNTTKGPLSKIVTLTDKKFEAGKIAKMTVDMAEAEFAESKVYDLVTDVAELTAGSEIIIAALNQTTAISSTQNGNNRGEAGQSKTNGAIVDPIENVEIFVVEEGASTGTYAFKATKNEGYIYAAGGTTNNNHLKTQATKAVVSSWTVAIAASGAATIKCADASVVRNTLRYNSSNKIFSCYASGQNDVAIYKLKGSGTALENYLNVSPESIEVDADDTSATFTVLSDLEWTATSENATVTTDGNTVTVTFDENTVEEVKTYTVTVKADGVDPKTVTITQKAWVDTSAIEELTVAEFKGKTPSTTVWYKLTGTVSNIASTTYGNFDLVDETGSVYIYGLTKTQLSSNDKSFASLGIKAGDEVTLITVRGEYNGTIQGGGQTTPAYYVSHKVACAAPVITCTDNTVTITAETGATVYYTMDGEDPTTTSSVYAAPFTITETVTVKAIAVADGKVQSAIASKSCTYVDPDAEQPGTVAQTYSYTFTSSQFSANASKALGELTWTLSGDGGYWGYDGTKGQQLGSGSKPYKSLELSTGDCGVVNSIEINTSGASSINATLKITVGGVQYGSDIKLTTSATEYTVEGNASGEIKFTYTQTSSKAIYIKSIKIN